MQKQKSAPCESCPAGCGKCAWDHAQSTAPQGQLVTVRTAVQYGCVKNAAVVVDTARRQPFMQIGGKLHPLSIAFGGIIAGTKLAGDIAAAATVAAA